MDVDQLNNGISIKTKVETYIDDTRSLIKFSMRSLHTLLSNSHNVNLNNKEGVLLLESSYIFLAYVNPSLPKISMHILHTTP